MTGTELLIAGTVLSAGATVAQGAASREAGRARQSQLELQAAAEETNVEIEALEREKKLRRILAQQRAETAASGIQFVGTPVTIATESQQEAAEQARRRRSLGDIRAAQLRQQGQQARAAGNAAFRRGFINAGSTLLTGLGDVQRFNSTETTQ